MQVQRFVETTYRAMTVREQMVPAMQHLVNRKHRFSPRRCDGCLEAAWFPTMPGYQGGEHPLTS
jgi:hypothetical protein